MTKSNSDCRPYWFLLYGDPSDRRLWRPQKLNLVCPGLHLCQIDNSAQHHPNCSIFSSNDNHERQLGLISTMPPINHLYRNVKCRPNACPIGLQWVCDAYEQFVGLRMVFIDHWLGYVGVQRRRVLARLLYGKSPTADCAISTQVQSSDTSQ